MMLVRTHVLLPMELVEEVDRVAGARRRSRFVEEAIRQHLRREALSTALRETAGALRDDDYPAWDGPEKASAWVRDGRKADEARLSRKLKAPRR
jgi:predicted transcriptional regulator